MSTTEKKYCKKCEKETYHFGYFLKCANCELNYSITESLEEEYLEWEKNNSIRHQLKSLYIKIRILEKGFI